ncbi:hypothetical protein [Salinarimonas sp.]|uniref:hypothetical protein n=1 Tax=Salinarimonas sp. TaxID=2766526 RepID=UPI00391AAC7B
MRYQPPFTQQPNGSIIRAEPDAPYVNGNPAIGQPGSIIPAEAVEHPMREIENVIRSENMEPTDDLTELNQAIEAKIARLTGQGPSELYATVPMLLGLPFFPEILSANNLINITSPAAGTILVPSGVGYRFRGGALNLNTSSIPEQQRLFSTLQNKSYHLICDQGAPLTWILRDVSDPSYNPDGHPEDHPALDAGYGRIIAARVQTDGANIPTITLLRNAHELFVDVGRATYLQLGNFNNSHMDTHPIGWARRPRSIGLTRLVAAPSSSLRDMGELQLSPTSITRYQMQVTAVASGDPDGPAPWRLNYAPIYNYRLGA